VSTHKLPHLAIALCIVCALLALTACSNTSAPVSSGNAQNTAPTSSSATTNTATTNTGTNTSAQLKSNIKVTLLGDSVPLGAITQLKTQIPGVDLQVRTDRTLSGDGLKILKQEAKSNKLGQVVVIALGTNYLQPADIDNAMQVIGTSRQVVFVNAYQGDTDYIATVNATIAAAAQKYPNFTVCDWHGYVVAHPSLKLATDNCHLTPSSAVDYATLIKTSVAQVESKM
jgi:hypothetical protein